MFRLYPEPRSERRESARPDLTPTPTPFLTLPNLYVLSASAFSSPYCLCRCRALARPVPRRLCSGGSLDPRRHMPANSRRIRTYEKYACNSFGMRTFKTEDLKLFRMNSSEKTAGGIPVLTRYPPTKSSGLVAMAACPGRPTHARRLADRHSYFVTSLLPCFFLAHSPLQSPRSIPRTPSLWARTSPWGIDER